MAVAVARQAVGSQWQRERIPNFSPVPSPHRYISSQRLAAWPTATHLASSHRSWCLAPQSTRVPRPTRTGATT